MSIKKVVFSLFLLFALIPAFCEYAYAGDYSYFLGSISRDNGRRNGSVADINLTGFNETHGFSKTITGTSTRTYQSGDGGRYLYDLFYSLPNDGSTWRVQGYVLIYVSTRNDNDDIDVYTFDYQYYPIDITINTPGTFTGVSIGQAVSAANSAKTSADTASARALNTYNAVTDGNGNTVSAVRDADGSVLSAARQANSKLDTMQTTINNIQNNLGWDTTPPTVKLKTVSGARATTGTFIATYVIVTDNSPGPYYYSVNSGIFLALPDDKKVNLPVPNCGENSISVKVRDQAGNEDLDVITIRGL